jgi:hypothetical protein
LRRCPVCPQATLLVVLARGVPAAARLVVLSALVLAVGATRLCSLPLCTLVAAVGAGRLQGMGVFSSLALSPLEAMWGFEFSGAIWRRGGSKFGDVPILLLF